MRKEETVQKKKKKIKNKNESIRAVVVWFAHAYHIYVRIYVHTNSVIQWKIQYYPIWCVMHGHHRIQIRFGIDFEHIIVTIYFPLIWSSYDNAIMAIRIGHWTVNGSRFDFNQIRTIRFDDFSTSFSAISVSTMIYESWFQ